MIYGIKKYIKLVIAMLVFTNVLYAKQDSQYTPYMYNPVNINPASAVLGMC